jgi:hypothetical protein
MTTTIERFDFFLGIYLHDESNHYTEKHLWISEGEAVALKNEIEKVVKSRGYTKAQVILEQDGDYHWIVDDSTNLFALAKEIADYTGARTYDPAPVAGDIEG